ncbi:MAG: HAD family phosphatase [Clostridia bacterium]|nr:HAD family phosphatase [Clostridia bacterium]
MKPTMLASDFDGTLCQKYSPETYPATPEVLAAIREFREDGGLFGVATGRDWYWSWRELHENGKLDFDFIISLNGAQIYDRAGALLYEATADGKTEIGGQTLIRALADRCWELVGDYFTVIVGKTRYNFSKNMPMGGEYDDDLYVPHTVLDEITTFHMAGTRASDMATALSATDTLLDEFGAYLNVLHTGGRSLDIPPAGIDKGVAVSRLAERLGVAQENIWTAGDSGNDLAMLAPFHGCAMTDGAQEAKDAAEFVCRDLTEVIARIKASKSC